MKLEDLVEAQRGKDKPTGASDVSRNGTVSYLVGFKALGSEVPSV